MNLIQRFVEAWSIVGLMHKRGLSYKDLKKTIEDGVPVKESDDIILKAFSAMADIIFDTVVKLASKGRTI